MAVACSERCLGNIFLCDPDLVVARSQIDLAEDLSAVEPVYKLIDSRERVPILDHLFVECSIVYAHSEIAAFLLHKEY